jgi:uncharacterized membrane protein YkoI
MIQRKFNASVPQCDSHEGLRLRLSGQDSTMSMRTPILLISLILCFGTGAAHAELSLQQAIEKVQHDTNGKVLSAEPIQVGKKKIYRIKVLTRDGQVRVIQVNADES